MRSPNCGMIENVSRRFSDEETLDMFERMCLSRYFEFKVAEAFNAGLIKMPIYLSVGQESISAALSVAFNKAVLQETDFKFFPQHRCHDWYLAYGGDPVALKDELLHKPTGCAKGMGGSASIHCPQIGMVGHDGHMGTQAPIAMGSALAKGHKRLVILGDASAEEDWVCGGAVPHAATTNAPVLFICADNGLSILTTVDVRRSWKTTDNAQGYGMPAVEITDDPWLIMHYVKHLRCQLPAYINIHTVRHLWHNGTGKDGPPEWDRFLMVRQELKRLGLEKQSHEIETGVQEYVAALWAHDLKGANKDGN